MLPIPEVITVLGDGLLGIDLDEVGGVLGVLVERGHRRTSRLVFDDAMIVDEVVERFLQLLAAQFFGSGIVVCRRSCRERVSEECGEEKRFDKR